MNYYVVEPEVAGGFGANAVLDPTVRPPNVSHFHFEFDGWAGDPILETVASYIVTEQLKKAMEETRLSGASFGEVEISKSGEFEDLYPGRQLPQFAWLKVTGEAGKDDFGLSSAHRLVVSERALATLNAEGMSHCEIREFQP